MRTIEVATRMPNASVLGPRRQFRVLASQTGPQECETVHIQHPIWEVHVQETSVRIVVSTGCFPGHHVRNVRRH